MSDPVRDAIAVDAATLARVADVPIGDLAYGIDLSCVSDITETLDEVDPESVVAIGEASIRRLTTPRGTLADDPEYGINLAGYLNRGTTTTELRTLAGDCRNELRKDDRVDDVEVSVEFATADSTLRVTAVIAPADPALNTFTLTFTVSDTEALLESIA